MWWWLVPAVLLLGAVAVAPRLLRGWTRRRRLAAEGPAEDRVEGAWSEVRATAVDLRLGWDDGATLRQRARALAAPLAGDVEALRALETVLLGVERSRFSRRGVGDEAVDTVVTEAVRLCDHLERAVGDGTRRRARWLPVSLWRGRRRQLTVAAAGSGSAPEDGAPRRTEDDLVSV